MRIFDVNNAELVECDSELGYLKDDRLFIKHHEAVESVAEQGHYETLVEYPNGGKDVEWVVDVPGVQAQDAYDEYEDILRYIPFTEKELATRRIEELKMLLQNTDYTIIKIAEGVATTDEYAEVITNRAAWRTEINELEKVKE